MEASTLPSAGYAGAAAPPNAPREVEAGDGQGYSDLVDLAKIAFPQDKDGSVAELKGFSTDYLSHVHRD